MVQPAQHADWTTATSDSALCQACGACCSYSSNWPRYTTEDDAALDLSLFEALREWRATTARSMGVPAYVVFPDATLAEVARLRPRSEDDLLGVKGIGPRKLEAYGADLLRIVRDPVRE